MFIDAISLKIKNYSAINIWTNAYGIGRSMLAFAMLLTFLFDNTNIFFRKGVGIEQSPACYDIAQIGMFCLFSEHLEVARWIAIIILILVITGWYPQITGILHW